MERQSSEDPRNFHNLRGAADDHDPQLDRADALYRRYRQRVDAYSSAVGDHRQAVGDLGRSSQGLEQQIGQNQQQGYQRDSKGNRDTGEYGEGFESPGTRAEYERWLHRTAAPDPVPDKWGNLVPPDDPNRDDNYDPEKQPRR